MTMLQLSERVTVGHVFGRWTVTKRLHPARRRPSDTGVRQRVVTRCVCGHECPVWVQDLVDGRSVGCRSLVCRTRHQAVGELEAAIDRMWSGDNVRRQQALKLKARLRRWLGEAREHDDKAARERLEEQLSGDEADGEAGVDWEDEP